MRTTWWSEAFDLEASAVMTREQVTTFVTLDATTAGVIGVTLFLFALALAVWWLGRGKR